MNPSARRFVRAAAWAVGVLVVLVVMLHFTVRRVARIEAPKLSVRTEDLQESKSLRRVGASYARRVGKLTEVGLGGSPVAIGYAHSRLLHSEMIETERVVWELLTKQVPNPLGRVALLDLAQFRFRRIAEGFSKERIEEIASAAVGFSPDPFQNEFATFQRFVYLNALYDIALSFERSPLIGCTTFVFSGTAAEPGHPLLARAFDFDVHDVFDQRKAVFLVREDGKIPYASVAWPGLVGVVSGMNVEGVAVVVHGARAGETQDVGEPVVQALRRVLGSARTAAEAVSALSRLDALVSHIVIVLDATGNGVKMERIPGHAPSVHALAEKAVVTNHLEGPNASDEKNQRVRETTTTLDRERRGREIIGQIAAPVDVAKSVGALRDRKGPGGAALPAGDRRAIDAHIATHGVVMDTGAKVLWVSEAPHLSGRFVAFDLSRLLAPGFDPSTDIAGRAAVDVDLRATER